MKSKEKSSTSSGIGVIGLLVVLLTVLFTGLQLTGHIDWAWYWVASPVIIYFGIGVLVIVGLLLFMGVCWLAVGALELMGY